MRHYFTVALLLLLLARPAGALTLRGPRVVTMPAEVAAIAFAPQGDTLAVGLTDGRVLFYDARRGTVIAQLPGAGVSAACLAFTPDGRYLAVGYTRFTAAARLTLWNWRQAKVKWTTAQDGKITGVAVAPDGNYIATGYLLPAGPDDERGIWRGQVKVWTAASGALLYERTLSPPATLSATTASIAMVAFTPDGSGVVASNLQGVHRWDAKTGNAEGVLAAPGSECNGGFAFAPDGNTVAVCAVVDGTHDEVQLWDWRRKKLQRRFADKMRLLEGDYLCYLPATNARDAGRYLATIGDFYNRPRDADRAALWDTRTGRRLYRRGRAWRLPGQSILEAAPRAPWLATVRSLSTSDLEQRQVLLWRVSPPTNPERKRRAR